jgi:tetratricopeptide (TPR) repeat protein
MINMSIHKYLLKLLLAVILVLSLGLLVGCPDDDADGEEEKQDAVELTQYGWWEFEDLNWNKAIEFFNQAISVDNRYSDAYSGAGWAKYKLNDLDGALSMWNEGKNKIGDINDIRSGIAFLQYQRGEYESCVTNCESVISSNRSWSFGHLPGLDILDLHWTVAASKYLLGDFDGALQTVKLLNSNFSINLMDGNGGYDSEALFILSDEIMRLETIVRG